jgi:ferredoxin-NADP reductase
LSYNIFPVVNKNTNIAITVKENLQETPGYRSVVFDRTRGFEYESGDWIDIKPSNKDLKGGPTYSLSSSPTEPDLMITFKEGLSEMKHALTACKPGDTFVVFQYGNAYQFTLKPHKTSMLIAGGVGVAPFRSMIKEMADTRDISDVSLLYLNKTSEFLYKDELIKWSELLPNLHTTYIVTEELNRKDQNNAITSLLHSTEQFFYIAGPEGMVETTEHLLLANGVSLHDIKIDSFSGY